MKTMLKNLSLMIAVLISLCSCNEIWQNPISDVQDAKVDKRLIGTWVPIDHPDTPLLLISEYDQHSVYVVLFDGSCPSYFGGYISELDGRTFANLRSYDCSKKEFSKYGIFEYEFNGENEMSFYIINDDFVNEAIRDKRLSGYKKEGGGLFGENIVVTATSPEIREFIKKSPEEKLFNRDEPATLKRFESPKATKRSICILF